MGWRLCSISSLSGTEMSWDMRLALRLTLFTVWIVSHPNDLFKGISVFSLLLPNNNNNNKKNVSAITILKLFLQLMPQFLQDLHLRFGLMITYELMENIASYRTFQELIKLTYKDTYKQFKKVNTWEVLVVWNEMIRFQLLLNTLHPLRSSTELCDVDPGFMR